MTCLTTQCGLAWRRRPPTCHGDVSPKPPSLHGVQYIHTRAEYIRRTPSAKILPSHGTIPVPQTPERRRLDCLHYIVWMWRTKETAYPRIHETPTPSPPESVAQPKPITKPLARRDSRLLCYVYFNQPSHYGTRQPHSSRHCVW
jgi:hypothetical protein